MPKLPDNCPIQSWDELKDSALDCDVAEDTLPVAGMFLVATNLLYKSLCPLVRWSVSVDHSSFQILATAMTSCSSFTTVTLIHSIEPESEISSMREELQGGM